MTITITLDHADIVGTDGAEFDSLFVLLQAYAKMTRGPMMLAPDSLSSRINPKGVRENIKKNYADKGNYTEETHANSILENPPETKKETPPVENPISRKDIETAIKQIALDGKEKGVSKKIKEIIHEYGVEKLSDVPNEKMPELLEKVKAI